MSRISLYRNAQARDQLDIFLISAVSSVLLIRFYLYLTGYPQIGAGGLHIAHVLFGGLFMLAAISVSLSFLGRHAERLAAFLGGLGFGVFIDELGKFITRDNDYFFRPTVGIIYAVFLGLYLIFNFLSRGQRLSSREYQLNALAQIEEAIAHDMDTAEKALARHYLARASATSQITQHLKDLLASIETVPTRADNRIEKILKRADKVYKKFWKTRGSNRLVRLFFIAEVSLFLIAVIGANLVNLDELKDFLSGSVTYDHWLVAGQLLSSALAVTFGILGTLKLSHSRVAAFEEFRRATLINLFLTEFFIFSRVQFQALPGFVFNLVLLLLISYVFRQEQRLSHQTQI